MMKANIGKRLPLSEAFSNARAHRDSHLWPNDESGRLLPHYVPKLEPSFRIPPGAQIFAIGSCFARTMEIRLRSHGFHLPMFAFEVPSSEWPNLPNGILNKYGPPNMLQEVERAARCWGDLDKVDAETERLLLPSGSARVIDMELGGFLPVTRERAVERRRDIHKTFMRAFDSDVVIVIMGLIECWFDHSTGLAIQETPTALPFLRVKERFGYELLGDAVAYRYTRRMIELLLENGRKDKKLLLTVDPIPIQATFTGLDVVIANCYGKSVLRAAAQRAADEFDCIDYFPSYEMVSYSRALDTWEDDLVHVRPEMVWRLVDALVEQYR